MRKARQKDKKSAERRRLGKELRRRIEQRAAELVVQQKALHVFRDMLA